VVLIARDADNYAVDEDATAKLRAELTARRTSPLPAIDRGEGYEKMLRGECAPRMR
jgi:N-methylhydantoinase B